MKVDYNNEYPSRLRLAAIGCGGHAVRNVFPTHLYAPVDLIAVCDIDRHRAEAVARLFGGKAIYSDYREMLSAEKPQAVQVVTNYDAEGRPRYPQIAMDAMKAGAHVWIEKPPACSSDDIRAMMDVSRDTGKFVCVGFKKMFFPANVKAKEIISRPEFGPITTITARYPQHLPPLPDRSEVRKMQGFLDHMVHPFSLLLYLAGPAETIYVQRHDGGGTITAIKFRSGAVGSLHMPAGQQTQGAASPLEYTEVVGTGGNLIVDNNIRLRYFRSGDHAEGGYGRAGTWFGPDESAALTWEPEFSLGQLYNKGIFLLGYAPEFRYFCQCALENERPRIGGLEDALHLLNVYEAYCKADAQTVTIAD